MSANLNKRSLFAIDTTFPGSLPPSGAAGGDLSGTYPNPSVVWANGYTTYDARYLMSSDGVSSFNTRVGAVTLTSGDVTTALGYTPYNATNPSGYITSAYLTDTLINGKLLTGYVSGAGTVSATDSILQGIQKINGNVNALVTGVSSVNSLTGAVALTGTANRLTISAANVFDISSSYVGQSSITTLGTIGTGTWNASVIGLTYGGTNANLTASNGGIFYSTASTGAILSGTASANKMLLSGATAAPTWSTSTIPTSAGISGKILISDGTNYILSTPTFPNASATTNKFIVSDGTNWIASTTTRPDSATTGDILYASASNVYSNLADVAAGSYLRSGGVTTAPVWSTLILPNTATVNQMVYASATNTYGGSANLTFDGNTVTLTGAFVTAADNSRNPISVVRGTNSGILFEGVKSGSTDKMAITGYYDANGVVGLYGTNMYYDNSGTSTFYNSSHIGLAYGTDNRGTTANFFLQNKPIGGGASTFPLNINNSGRCYFNGSNTGTPNATAVIHIVGGTATASTAPLKFTSGTNLTTAEAGAMEYNGTNLFFTRAGTTRENVIVAVDNATAPSTSVGVGIVNYYGAAATNFLGDPNRWISVNILGTIYKIPLYT